MGEEEETLIFYFLKGWPPGYCGENFFAQSELILALFYFL